MTAAVEGVDGFASNGADTKMVLRSLVLCLVIVTAPLRAQYYGQDLIRDARARMAAQAWDSAARDLAIALDEAPYIMDSCWVYIWRGVLEYERGSAALARLNFRRALLLHPNPRASGYAGLDSIPWGAAKLFDGEYRDIRVFSAGDPDHPATWIAGPSFEYPAEALARRLSGQAVARWIVDTSGHVDRRNIDVIELPDSSFMAPLKDMVTATLFQPATIGGQRVRSYIAYQFKLRPPASTQQNPVQLVDNARRQLRANRPDSALALVERALDPTNDPTAAMQVYAELVRGIAWHTQSRNSLASRSFKVAIAKYRELERQGVDFAPFLRNLVDSVRLTNRYKYEN